MKDVDAALTDEERALRSLLRFWTLLFGAGAVSFAADPDRSTASLNLLPGPSLPESSEKYWNALAVSLMATITVLSAMAATDVRRRRALVWPLMVSKAVSSGMYLRRFSLAPALRGQCRRTRMRASSCAASTTRRPTASSPC